MGRELLLTSTGAVALAPCPAGGPFSLLAANTALAVARTGSSRALRAAQHERKSILHTRCDRVHQRPANTAILRLY